MRARIPLSSLLPVLLSCLVLAACARNARPDASYLARGVTDADALILAGDAVQYLTGPLPPAHTTVQLHQSRSRGDALGRELLEELRSTGYGVVEASRRSGTSTDVYAVPVYYRASPMDGGVVLHLRYHGMEASRFYPRTADGSLVVATPFTIREFP